MKTKFFLVLFLSITPCLSAVAQQATNTLAPTMPGKGNLVIRPIFNYYKLKPSEQNLFSGTVLESAVHFDYGLTGATSLMLHVSEERQDEDQEMRLKGFTDLLDELTYSPDNKAHFGGEGGKRALFAISKLR